MKLLGAVLLTAAASVMGLFKARELKASSQSLREIISLLELMRNEICTRRTPMKMLSIRVTKGNPLLLLFFCRNRR